jgi:hypothetical protein
MRQRPARARTQGSIEVMSGAAAQGKHEVQVSIDKRERSEGDAHEDREGRRGREVGR